MTSMLLLLSAVRRVQTIHIYKVIGQFFMSNASVVYDWVVGLSGCVMKAKFFVCFVQKFRVIWFLWKIRFHQNRWNNVDNFAELDIYEEESCCHQHSWSQSTSFAIMRFYFDGVLKARWSQARSWFCSLF